MPDIRKQIYDYMNHRLMRLEDNLKHNRNTEELANLRRGIGRLPGDMPELWGLLFADFPEELMSRKESPSYAEWGIYTALTLYALHQQGNPESVHEKGIRLGQALAGLAESEEDEARIARRFNAFATADDMIEASYYLRGLIQLLKAKGLLLDYAGLADELYQYQLSDEIRSQVRLK